jgi:hypothetical protein
MVKILFRADASTEDELGEAIKVFGQQNVVQGRGSLARLKDECRLVIGRYSVLPFYKELHQDVIQLGWNLVHTPKQHDYIAKFGWYEDLKGMTPRTWFDHNFSEAPEVVAYVVKGETNSKKLQWNKKCFAANKRQALDIAAELSDDGGLLGQRILYREYNPLKQFAEGINGLPITNEWRFFIFKRRIFAIAYYWKELLGEQPIEAVIDNSTISLVANAISCIGDNAIFYTVDVGQRTDGLWTVIEINEGQQAGLCGLDPNTFYRNLKNSLDS